MEFRFACDVMKIPTILAVVGTKNKWTLSEVKLWNLSRALQKFESTVVVDRLNFQVNLLGVRNNLKEFNLQFESESVLEALVNEVKTHSQDESQWCQWFGQIVSHFFHQREP